MFCLREKFHSKSPTETLKHREFYKRIREIASAATFSSVSPLCCIDFALVPVAFPADASVSCGAGDMKRSPAGTLAYVLELLTTASEFAFLAPLRAGINITPA